MRPGIKQFTLDPFFYRVYKSEDGMLHVEESREDPTLTCTLQVGELDLSEEEDERLLLNIVATWIGVLYA